MQAFTYTERPDLAERTGEVGDPWPEFIHHADVTAKYWHLLREELPDLQYVLYDDERDRVVGRAQSIPARAAAGLPGGVDDLLETWFGGRRPEPDCVSAVVALVDPGRQGKGLSSLLVEAMHRGAAAAGFASLIAPVRPILKDRYPLIPLDRYASWRRDDGRPWDPWIRLHSRLGAELLEVCEESMRVTGTRAEWESWTGLAFPDDGDYVVPGALVPVRFAHGVGTYVEPNVWMRHRV